MEFSSCNSASQTRYPAIIAIKPRVPSNTRRTALKLVAHSAKNSRRRFARGIVYLRKSVAETPLRDRLEIVITAHTETNLRRNVRTEVVLFVSVVIVHAKI